MPSSPFAQAPAAIRLGRSTRRAKRAPRVAMPERQHDPEPPLHEQPVETPSEPSVDERRAEQRKRWKAKPLTVRVFSRMVRRTVWALQWSAYGVSWAGAKYPLLRLLVLTHSLGAVTRKRRRMRLMCCDSCEYLYTYHEQRYCRGENGGRGCGCGHWKGSRITHKVKLSLYACPIGRFDYGLLGRIAVRLLKKGA